MVRFSLVVQSWQFELSSKPLRTTQVLPAIAANAEVPFPVHLCANIQQSIQQVVRYESSLQFSQTSSSTEITDRTLLESSVQSKCEKRHKLQSSNIAYTPPIERLERDASMRMRDPSHMMMFGFPFTCLLVRSIGAYVPVLSLCLLVR